MPLINVKVMENVLSADQKQEVASRFTDAFAEVVGEPCRPLTWVVIEDMTSGQLVVGGDAITTQTIQGLLDAAPATAGAR
jgi:4-oxalocrotonate tautomerase